MDDGIGFLLVCAFVLGVFACLGITITCEAEGRKALKSACEDVCHPAQYRSSTAACECLRDDKTWEKVAR